MGESQSLSTFALAKQAPAQSAVGSHVMTIIWYLGYAQYNDIRVPNPNIINVSITTPKVQTDQENMVLDSGDSDMSD